MSKPAPQPGADKSNAGQNSSVRALIKVEKLTQIAFVLPVSVLVGWLLGAFADRLLHRHWLYLAGLVLGAVAGFLQLFRMIAEPGLLGPAAAPAPKYDDDRDEDTP